MKIVEIKSAEMNNKIGVLMDLAIIGNGCKIWGKYEIKGISLIKRISWNIQYKYYRHSRGRRVIVQLLQTPTQQLISKPKRNYFQDWISY